MIQAVDPRQLEVLRAYAAGQLGTRGAIEAFGAHDYADRIIALAQNDLAFPQPAATPRHEANVARARAILQPWLRHAG
jgi:hypothetical protein